MWCKFIDIRKIKFISMNKAFYVDLVLKSVFYDKVEPHKCTARMFSPQGA